MPAHLPSALVTAYEKLPGALAGRLSQLTLSLCRMTGCKDVDWRVPAHYFTTLDRMAYLGDHWSVPADRQRYMEFRFGSDWRISRQQYSTLREYGAVQR